jgi:hypothetical protein
MGFDISASAECDFCGNLLTSSDDDCGECVSADREQHLFRRLTSGDGPDTIAVESTVDYRWHKLQQEVGDDWIAYEWLGPRDSVQSMLGRQMWDTIQDIPCRQMSLDAPSDVPSPETEQ